MSDETQAPVGGAKPVKPSAWWNPIYGKYREEKRAWRDHKRRVDALPDDYRWMMKQIEGFVWNFAGDANTMAGLDGILGLFEEGVASGQRVLDVTGEDVAGFAFDVLGAFEATSWIGKTGDKFNAELRELLDKQRRAADGAAAAGPDDHANTDSADPEHAVGANEPVSDEPTGRSGFGLIGKLRDDKREWRRQMARIAALPADYQLVYKQIQKYMWAQAVGTGYDILHLQYDLVDEFEAGALAGRPVLDITGPDVTGYCDELLRTTKTFTDTKRASLNRRVAKKFGTRSTAQ